MLKRESREVFRALQPLEETHKIEIRREESSEFGELFADLQTYGARQVIFHYGGHANGDLIQLEGGGGRSEGVARLLGQQDSLKLVFLNGCATLGHVSLLLDAGVPAVIATSVPIGDQKAQEFSVAFYTALAEGRSIIESFDSARGYVEGKHGDEDASGVRFTRDANWEGDAELESPVLEWGLYVHERCTEDIDQWRLPDARAAWQVHLSDTRGPVRNLDGSPLQLDYRLPSRTVPALSCPACGATTTTATDDPAVCPVCGGESVEQKPIRTRVADKLVRFTITERAARRRVLEHLGLDSAPAENGRSTPPPIRLSRIHLPYWVFDVDTRTTVKAERGWNRALAEPTAKFQWEPVRENIDFALDSRLVPAGTTPALSGPGESDWYWELSRAERCDANCSDTRSIPLDRSMQTAFDEVAADLGEEIRAEISDLIGGHRQRNIESDTRYRALGAYTVMLPHWHATTTVDGIPVHLQVNGQTGAVRRLQLRAPGAVAAQTAAADSALVGGVDSIRNPRSGGVDAMSERSYESSKRGETAPNWVSVFSGAGIGLMVGSLIGMSLSPVVGIFIGAVGTGLAALLGLNDRHFSVAKSLRIGSFGLAVLIAAPTGIYVRDHALLSPTLGDLAQQLVDFDIGIKNRSDAVKLLIQAPQTDTESASEGGQETATTEKSEAAGKSAPVPTVVERRPVTSQNDNVLRAAVEFFRKQRSGVYSTKVALTSCGELKGAYDETLTPAEVIRNFKVEKNGWDELAEAVEGTFEGEDRKSLLFIARDTVCESKPDLDPAQCDQLRNSVKSGSASNLNEAFGAVEQLQPTLDRVRNQITEGSQTAALVQLQKVLCPDKG